MTGAFEGRSSGTTGIPREHLAELGVQDEQVLFTTAGLPDRLLESHLEAWSYTPDFTGLVQILLERIQSERNLSIAVCGSPADSRARAHAALQLSIGLTQHGRSVAVVDADATLPGLAGLIADPHAEGLIDMVRFGRSCRSLLWKPLQTGPAVLPLGSFPVRGRLPFDADAVRGVLHRVALHTDVALYVAPLVEGEQLHPIAHACGQVVFVQGPESVTRGLDPELATWVTRGAIRLTGLVFHTADAATAEAPAATSWTVPPAAPAPAPTPTPTPPKFDAADLQPALDALEPQDEEPPPKTAAGVERTPAESAEVRERLRLGEAEFAYDEQVTYSRTPLYLLLTLVVLIGGFLGWVLWTERDIERRQLPTGSSASTTPTPPPPPTAPATDDSVGARLTPGSAASPPGAVTAGGAAADTAGVATPVVAAPETTLTSTTTSAAAGGVMYSVHVASYQKAARAQSDIDNLSKHGFEARSIRTDLGSKGIWYRVYVGSYPSRSAAAAAREAVLKLPEYSFAQVRRAPKP